MDKKSKREKFSHDVRGRQYIEDADFRKKSIEDREGMIKLEYKALEKAIDRGDSDAEAKRRAKIKVLKNKLAGFMERNPRGPAEE